MELPEDPELQRTLRAHAEYFVAPADLRAALVARVQAEHATDARRRLSIGKRLVAWFAPSLPQIGAAFAAGIAVTLFGARLFFVSVGDDAATVALLSDHSRALMTDTTIEVASSSSHTVKPWLSAKLGYSPSVVDLVSQGFPLLGGRRGFIGGIPLAVMVYAYREHEIDLYALRPEDRLHIERGSTQRDGYNIRVWDESGMRYVAVSDVAADRLDAFARLIRERQAHPAD